MEAFSVTPHRHGCLSPHAQHRVAIKMGGGGGAEGGGTRLSQLQQIVLDYMVR